MRMFIRAQAWTAKSAATKISTWGTVLILSKVASDVVVPDDPSKSSV